MMYDGNSRCKVCKWLMSGVLYGKKWLELDLDYVEIWTDVKMSIKTVLAVMNEDGVLGYDRNMHKIYEKRD